jgi:protein tyrosine/serine phosphatase
VGAIALVLASLAPPLPSHPSAPAHDVPDASVPNYGVIWEGKLTRSGQPRDEGWTWLRERGVRTLVNFRTEEDGDYQGVRFERTLWLPFSKKKPPTDHDAEEFLAFVRSRRHWPVHIHCEEGKDRTGLMAALARYAIDGWPLERALAEARTYREGEDLAPLYVAWLDRWAAGHAPGSHRLDSSAVP